MSTTDPRMAFYKCAVIDTLNEFEQPLSSRDIAHLAGLDFELVQSAVCLLIVSGGITQSHRDQDGKPAYVIFNHLPNGEEQPHV